MADTSIWKRELRLRKSKKPSPPAPPVDVPSVLDESTELAPTVMAPEPHAVPVEPSENEREPVSAHLEPDAVGGWPMDQTSEAVEETASADERSAWPSYAEVLAGYPEPSADDRAEPESDAVGDPDDRMTERERPRDAVESAVAAGSMASGGLEHVPEAPVSAPLDAAAGSEPQLVESLVAAAILSGDESSVAPEPVAATEAAPPAAVQPEAVQPETKAEGQAAPQADAKPGKRKAPSPSSSVKKLVGLRIGSSQLAAACVHNNGSAELMQIARSPLERGIVAGGEVRDPEALTRALKTFFAANKLPRRGVRLGIASNRIGVRILEVPALDDPKLFENSVRFHAQETLPIAVTDAITEHVVLGPGAGTATGAELEPTVRVLLVFAHRELVERHVEACRRAGLKLEGVDFEAFALLRALSEPRPEDVAPERAVVAVAVGNERTIFAVSDGRICDFTRVLEWGGGSLDVAMGRVMGLTPSQAEPIKRALSIGGDLTPPDLAEDQIAAVRDAIRVELQSLARELVASLQFYQARPGSLDIGEILLSGGGAQLIGFAEELERLVGVPVRAGDPFARIHLGKKVTMPAEPGSLAVAIGLGIEDR